MDNERGTTHAQVKSEFSKAFIFTTVARNYLSQAAVLFHSIKSQCQDAPFCCFIIDGYDDDKEIPEAMRGYVYDCRKLRVPGFEEMAFKYSVTEFATSLKPHIFRHLFEREGCESVVFLDPDTRLYCDTAWVEDELKHKSILLTPHVLEHEPYLSTYAGRKPFFPLSKLLFAGIYNTGFVAIKNDTHGRAFLTFWAQILRHHCLHKFCYDQKWAELIPNFFGDQMGMIKDPGANVAYWNLHERFLTRDANSNYLVNGSRLKFMHFSKLYRVRDIWKWEGSEHEHIRNPEYADIYRGYLAELVEAGFKEGGESTPYRYNYFDNGMQVNMVHRRIYAKMITRAEVPNPFSASGRFYAHLKSRRLLEPKANAGLYGAKCASWVTRRLLGSPIVFRWLYRILGSRNYLALLKRMEESADLDENVSLIA